MSPAADVSKSLDFLFLLVFIFCLSVSLGAFAQPPAWQKIPLKKNEYVVDRDDAFGLLNDIYAQEKDFLIMGNALHLVVLEELAHYRLNIALASWLLQY